MVNLDKKDLNVLVNVLISILWVSVFFLIIFSFYGVKVLNGDSCGLSSDTFNSGALVSSSFVLNSNNKALTQLFLLDDKNTHTSYEMCFKANISSSGGMSVSIVNNDLIVSSLFIYEDREDYCVKLGLDDLVEGNNYVGVRCDSCNDSELMVFYEDVSKVNRVRVVSDVNNNVSVSQGEMVSIGLFNGYDCVGFVKSMFRAFLIFVALLFGFILVWYGIGWFKNMLFGFFDEL